MKLFYFTIVAVLFALVLVGCLSQPAQYEPTVQPVQNISQQSNVKQIDLTQYADSSSRFIAEIANELLKATS